MTSDAQEVIERYSKLSESEKEIVFSAILRDTPNVETPPLEDDALVLSAEETLLEIEQRRRIRR